MISAFLWRFLLTLPSLFPLVGASEPYVSPAELQEWLREEEMNFHIGSGTVREAAEKDAVDEAEQHIARAIRHFEEAAALEEMAELDSAPYRGVQVAAGRIREEYRRGVWEFARAVRRSHKIKELMPPRQSDGTWMARDYRNGVILYALGGAIALGAAAGTLITGSDWNLSFFLPVGVGYTTLGLAGASRILPLKRSNGVLTMLRARLREARDQLSSATGTLVLGQLALEAGERPKNCRGLLEPIPGGA